MIPHPCVPQLPCEARPGTGAVEQRDSIVGQSGKPSMIGAQTFMGAASLSTSEPHDARRGERGRGGDQAKPGSRVEEWRKGWR
eukprot:1650837-Alexandrium_andersonii.AAC.1